MIALKYNWGILGHEPQLGLIESDIESDNLYHAYLLCGPSNIGKFCVAKKMAQILQCEKNCCLECKTCKEVLAGTHSDTIEILNDGKAIGIDQVRELSYKMSFSSGSKKRIFLLEEVDRMTREAANSFLKSLEEPLKNTVIIMTTRSATLLLKTFVSRARIVKFLPASVEFLKGAIKKNNGDLSEEDVEKISLLSMGRVGLAIRLANDPELLMLYLEIYNSVLRFLDHKNVADRFYFVEKMHENKVKITLFYDILVAVLRSRLLNGGEGEWALSEKIEKAEEYFGLINKNVNARLALENLMLHI